jgi:hypothetical protein
MIGSADRHHTLRAESRTDNGGASHLHPSTTCLVQLCARFVCTGECSLGPGGAWSANACHTPSEVVPGKSVPWQQAGFEGLETRSLTGRGLTGRRLTGLRLRLRVCNFVGESWTKTVYHNGCCVSVLTDNTKTMLQPNVKFASLKEQALSYGDICSAARANVVVIDILCRDNKAEGL